MLNPEAEMSIAAAAERARERWEGKRPLVAAPAEIPISKITIGCEIWCTTEGPNARMNPDCQPRGGVVVDKWDFTASDGEILDMYRAIDLYVPLERAYGVFNETHIAVAYSLDRGHIERLIRHLTLAASQMRDTPRRKDMITDAFHLQHLLTPLAS